MNEKRKPKPLEMKVPFERDPFFNVTKQFEGFHFGMPSNLPLIPNLDFSFDQTFGSSNNVRTEVQNIPEDSLFWKKKYEEEVQKTQGLIQKREEYKNFVKIFTEIEEQQEKVVEK